MHCTITAVLISNSLGPVALVARLHLEWIVQKAKIFELGQLANFGEFAPVLRITCMLNEFDFEAYLDLVVRHFEDFKLFEYCYSL